jgi:hypothetical protein
VPSYREPPAGRAAYPSQYGLLTTRPRGSGLLQVCVHKLTDLDGRPPVLMAVSEIRGHPQGPLAPQQLMTRLEPIERVIGIDIGPRREQGNGVEHIRHGVIP